MDLYKKDPNKERFKANFIHYAGAGYEDPNGDKLALVKKDFKEVFNI